MSQSQEHRFNTILRPPRKNRKEVNTKYTGKFRCSIHLHVSSSNIRMLFKKKVTLGRIIFIVKVELSEKQNA
jgi:hypothetical protein